MWLGAGVQPYAPTALLKPVVDTNEGHAYTRTRYAVRSEKGNMAALENIVDAHVHIWSPDTDKYPLATGFGPKDPWFPSFTAEELLEHCRPSGVSRINLVQITWYGLDHSYIVDVIARDPEHFVGTGMVPAVTDVTLAEPDAIMVALAHQGIYAFRVRGRSSRTHLKKDRPRWLDHPGYEKMFSAGAENNLALSFLMDPEDIGELDRMCARYPDTPVIIDHMARVHASGGAFPDEDVDALCRMAIHKKVMVKVGAFYAGDRQPPYLDLLPLVRRIVEAFGPERCMWESDSPLQTMPPHTYEPGLALIRDHADFLSASDKEQVLVKTAEDFFFKR